MFFLSTYPSLAVALLAEEAPGTATSVTCFDGGRVRHLEHLHFAAEEIRRIGWDVPRARGGTATRTINFATAVRHKSPRRLPLLRKRLDFVLEHNNNNTKFVDFEMVQISRQFFKKSFYFLREKRKRTGFCRWTCDGQLIDPNSNAPSPIREGRCGRRLR